MYIRSQFVSDSDFVLISLHEHMQYGEHYMHHLILSEHIKSLKLLAPPYGQDVSSEDIGT